MKKAVLKETGETISTFLSNQKKASLFDFSGAKPKAPLKGADGKTFLLPLLQGQMGRSYYVGQGPTKATQSTEVTPGPGETPQGHQKKEFLAGTCREAPLARKEHADALRKRHQSHYPRGVQGIKHDVGECPKADPEKGLDGKTADRHHTPEGETVKGPPVPQVPIKRNRNEKEYPAQK